jgi:hypothetical protein
MKKTALAIIYLFVINYGLSAQSGLYAGSYKKWVKKEVEVQKEAAFFKGFQHFSSMTILEDAEMDYYLYVYEKGTTSIILLITKIKDALSYTIQDIIEIKNVRLKDNIQTGTCSVNGTVDSKLVVLEKNSRGNQINTKAWRADIDKLRFTATSPKGINCIVEDAD